MTFTLLLIHAMPHGAYRLDRLVSWYFLVSWSILPGGVWSTASDEVPSGAPDARDRLWRLKLTGDLLAINIEVTEGWEELQK